MIVDALTFRLVRLDTDRIVGTAAVAPSARYCSFLPAGETRIVRRHPSPELWLRMEHEAIGMEAGPLPRESSFTAALVDAPSSTIIQWVMTLPVQIDRVSDVAASLDQTLRQVR